VPIAVDAKATVVGFSRICPPVGVGVIVGVGVRVGVGFIVGVGDGDTLYWIVPVAGLPDATTL
jgi:Na+/citrate or Na+/malate symporter